MRGMGVANIVDSLDWLSCVLPGLQTLCNEYMYYLIGNKPPPPNFFPTSSALPRTVLGSSQLPSESIRNYFLEGMF